MKSQKRIIDLLPTYLLMQIRGHVYNVFGSQYERARAEESNNIRGIESDPEEYIKRLIRGKLFEIMVANDLDIKTEMKVKMKCQ